MSWTVPFLVVALLAAFLVLIIVSGGSRKE